MKKLASLGVGALGAAFALAAFGTNSRAADHLDSPTLAGNPMGDINDVYAWMTTGNKLNLAMTVSPFEDGSHHFGPSVQYVFHTTSKASVADIAMANGTDANVICTFTSDTAAQCWVVSGSGTVIDYVSGDPSNAVTGMSSADGKLKVFAGKRSDPFFFNLGGFKNAIAAIEARLMSAPAVTTDGAGCPNNLTNTEVAGVRTVLTAPPSAATGHQAPCPDGAFDCFATFNVMSIVVQVDTSILNSGTNTILAVWGSTNQGS